MSRLDDIKARLDSQDDMELRYDDLAALVAVVEEVQRVRDTMLAEELEWEYPERRYANMLDDSLRPVTGEQPVSTAEDQAVNQLIVAASGVDPDTAARLGYPTGEGQK